MLTDEPTQTKYITAKPRWLRAVGALAAVLVVIGAGVGIWAVATDGGPVAAADARIEVTFDGDGTAYVGHREIVEGRVAISFTNGGDSEVHFALLRYDTGSVELADELRVLPEGESFRPGDHDPVGDFELVQGYPTGTHPVRMVLQPGTYLVDISHDQSGEQVVDRAAVIEVVAAD